MDVYKVQKMNQMAVNLKRHNIVPSTEDAIAQAERIYGQEYPKEKMDSNEIEELRKEVRKLSFSMQHLIEEFKEIKQKTDQLEKELNDARLGIVKKAQQTLNQQLGEEEKPKKDLTKPIDRNNVAPSEVSVEKFFYFGNK